MVSTVLLGLQLVLWSVSCQLRLALHVLSRNNKEITNHLYQYFYTVTGQMDGKRSRHNYRRRWMKISRTKLPVPESNHDYSDDEEESDIIGCHSCSV